MARGWIARKHRGDYQILVLASILLSISLIFVVSLSPALANLSDGIRSSSYFTIRQLIFVAIGSIAFAASSAIDVSYWKRFAPVLWGVTAISLLALFSPLAVEVNGATRWLNVAGVTVQPAELIKLSILLYLGSWLVARVRAGELHDRKATLYPLAGMLSVLGFVVVVLQNDLGTMIAISAIVFGAMYAAGVKLIDFGLMLLGALPLAVLAVLLAPHRVDRFTAFIPGVEATSDTHHIDQALIAVGSGGLTGKGIGRSVSVHGYLPEAETDSIFAIVSENTGFIGSVVVLVLYGLLLSRINRVADRAPSLYVRIVAYGIFAWFFAHIAINISAMLGLAPITGITLPLLSIGGTSLIVMMFALGMVFQLSKHTIREGAPQLRFDHEKGDDHGAAQTSHVGRRRNGRTRYATSTGN